MAAMNAAAELARAEALGMEPTVYEVYNANGQPRVPAAGLRPADHLAEEEEFFKAEPQGSSA